MEFFSYFYLGYDIESKFEKLAKLSKEKWSFGDKNDNSILKSYLQNTFLKLYEDNQIVEKETYCIFNTGLFTEYYEPIYAYAPKNNNPKYKPWFLERFVIDYELGDMGIGERPERANYFTDPSLLVFDVNCPINVQYRHILDDKDNIERFPIELQKKQYATHDS